MLSCVAACYVADCQLRYEIKELLLLLLLLLCAAIYNTAVFVCYKAELVPITKLSATEDDVQRRQSPGCINVEKLINKYNITSKSIDRMSRHVFPICFLAFNIIYWLTYAVFTDS